MSPLLSAYWRSWPAGKLGVAQRSSDRSFGR